MTRFGKKSVLFIVFASFLCLGTGALAAPPLVPIDPGLVLAPIDPGDIWVNPPVLSPCAGADYTLTLDKANRTVSQITSNSDTYQATFAMPLLIDGSEVGYLKIEYDRATVSGENDIQFVTAHDTFYFYDGFTAFGLRRNYEYGVYNGTGVITKIIDGSNNLLDIDLTYTFDQDDNQICVFIEQ